MLRPPCPHVLRPAQGVGVWTFFLDLFLDKCLPLLEVILKSFLGQSDVKKWTFFFERFLLALRSHFGRLLGCLGALLGRSVFPNHYEKQYKTMIFKIFLFRSRSSLGWLLQAILAHFGEVLGTKIRRKVAQKVTRNRTETYTKNIPILVHKMSSSQSQDCPRTTQDGPN